MTFDDLANFLLGHHMSLKVEWDSKDRKWRATIEEVETHRRVIALDDRLDVAVERAVTLARQVQP